MKKAKILIGALSLTAITPVMPMALTSCGCSTTKTYTVTFDSDGGTDVPSQTIIEGKCAAKPFVEKTGSELSGWYNGDELWDFNNKVTSDITLKAKWDASQLLVVLYSGDGTFTNTHKIEALTNVTPGTKLSEIEGYVKPSSGDYQCAYWLDVNGNKYDDNTPITKNILLNAKYRQVPSGTTWDKANWAQIIAKTKTAIDFASFFMGKTFTNEQDAIDYINNDIQQDAKSGTRTLTDKKMTIDRFGQDWEVSVRLIGCGFDKNEKSTNSKTLFTFEFVDSIATIKYTYENDHIWYLEDETGKVISNSYLRQYLNNTLINSLPVDVVEAMQEVTKTTLTPKTDEKVERDPVKTQEKLFPLRIEEYGVALSLHDTTYSLPEEQKATLTYPYYRFGTDVTIDKHNTKYFLGQESAQTCYSYWTRSPVTYYVEEGASHRVVCINPDTKREVFALARTDDRVAVAPAFCI